MSAEIKDKILNFANARRVLSYSKRLRMLQCRGLEVLGMLPKVLPGVLPKVLPKRLPNQSEIQPVLPKLSGLGNKFGQQHQQRSITLRRFQRPRLHIYFVLPRLHASEACHTSAVTPAYIHTSGYQDYSRKKLEIPHTQTRFNHSQ